MGGILLGLLGGGARPAFGPDSCKRLTCDFVTMRTFASELRGRKNQEIPALSERRAARTVLDGGPEEARKVMTEVVVGSFGRQLARLSTSWTLWIDAPRRS